MKVTHYRQCRMERPIEKGVQVLVSYLPDQFAKTGEVVKLKNAEDVWVDGWKILSVGELIPASIAEAGSRLHKKHRESTDVILSDLRKPQDDGSYRKNRD